MATKFKIGDKVRCKPGFTTKENSGGAGYEEDKEFEIGYIFGNKNDIAAINNYSNGIYFKALEYATPKEVLLTEIL
jgi:hypothetical protein